MEKNGKGMKKSDGKIDGIVKENSVELTNGVGFPT